MRKILCPFHEESTPSCVLYPNGYSCFGCGKRGPLSDIAGLDVKTVLPVPREDLEASMRYILSLPKERIRGLDLHADKEAYYIVWPNGTFYKARYKDDRKAKYRCPAGHTKPLLVANESQSKSLIIVEGEINALSLARICPQYTVMSPGGVGDFSTHSSKKNYTYYIRFDTILIIADKDEPGIRAVMELGAFLRNKRHDVRFKLMPTDANSILCAGGQEVENLRQEVERELGPALAEGATGRRMPPERV